MENKEREIFYASFEKKIIEIMKKLAYNRVKKTPDLFLIILLVSSRFEKNSISRFHENLKNSAFFRISKYYTQM